MGAPATIERSRAGPVVSAQQVQPPVQIHDNQRWAGAAPRISIILPFRRQNPLAILNALANLRGIADCEIITYDDGARDQDLTRSLQTFADGASSPVRLVRAAIPIGKARARNFLAGHCRAEWILMLEANTLPADDLFLRRYLNFIDRHNEPKLVFGGFCPAPPPSSPRRLLHHHHTTRSECLPATQRERAPTRHLGASNALFHKIIFRTCRFDELFRGHGWEGVDWGLRVARSYPISHIDNPLVRSEFDNDYEMLNRYRRSAPNFARLVAWHPHALDKSPLMRSALLARHLPFRNAITRLLGQITVSASLPIGLRGVAFKLWRALTYGSAL